jgi:hypothetical protein
MKKITLAALIAGLLIAGVAVAQNPPPGLFIASPNGTEQLNVYNTGPQITSVYLRQMRDAAGYSKNVPLTGFSLTFGNGQSIMEMAPAGTLSTGTITMAAGPVDGQRALIFSTQAVSTLTLAANTGQTINNAVTSLSANNAVEYLYSASNLTWDRVQ